MNPVVPYRNRPVVQQQTYYDRARNALSTAAGAAALKSLENIVSSTFDAAGNYISANAPRATRRLAAYVSDRYNKSFGSGNQIGYRESARAARSSVPRRPVGPYSMPPKYSRRGRFSYRRRSRWGRRSRVYSRKPRAGRNTYGFMQSQVIPRPLKQTFMPRRLQLVIDHWYSPNSIIGWVYQPTGAASPQVATYTWQNAGNPFGTGITTIPQAFTNVSKIYKRYLVCWSKFVATFPETGSTQEFTEQIYFFSSNTYTPDQDFSTMMTVPNRKYVVTKPRGSNTNHEMKKVSMFMRPNRVLGVDWRMYAGDEDNWGLLASAGSGAGTAPVNKIDLHVWSHYVNTSSTPTISSGSLRLHWQAKLQVWDTDEDWLRGSVAALAELNGAEVPDPKIAGLSSRISLQPVDDVEPSDDEEEEEPEEEEKVPPKPLKINVLKAKKKVRLD